MEGKKRKIWLDCDLCSQRQAPGYKQTFDINLISFTSLVRIKTVKASANKCTSTCPSPSVFPSLPPSSSTLPAVISPGHLPSLSSLFHNTYLSLSCFLICPLPNSIRSALHLLCKYHNHWWGKSAGISTRGLEEPFCVSFINVHIFFWAISSWAVWIVSCHTGKHRNLFARCKFLLPEFYLYRCKISAVINLFPVLFFVFFRWVMFWWNNGKHIYSQLLFVFTKTAQ